MNYTVNSGMGQTGQMLSRKDFAPLVTQGNIAASVPHPPPQTPVEGQTQLLGGGINALHGRISFLEERLRGVLTPAPADEAPRVGAEPTPCMAPLTLSLRELGDEVHRAIMRLERMIERIEA